jgi:hypothetical protein
MLVITSSDVSQFKPRSLKVRKGGLPPPVLKGTRPERGQATLPDLEVIRIDFSSFSIFRSEP